MTAIPSPTRRPVWWGILLALAGLALLAVPILWALLVAYVGFTGCFIECSSPDIGTALFGSAAVLLMVSAPVMAGAALVRRSRGWWIAAGCAAALVLIPLIYAMTVGAV